MRKQICEIIASALFVTLACLSAAAQIPGVTPPDHIVIVIEENHSFSEIIGNSSAPYINSLAQQGAVFTNSFAIEHPSNQTILIFFQDQIRVSRAMPVRLGRFPQQIWEAF